MAASAGDNLLETMVNDPISMVLLKIVSSPACGDDTLTRLTRHSVRRAASEALAQRAQAQPSPDGVGRVRRSCYVVSDTALARRS